MGVVGVGRIMGITGMKRPDGSLSLLFRTARLGFPGDSYRDGEMLMAGAKEPSFIGSGDDPKPVRRLPTIGCG
jgi:hypothetical protein